MKSVLDSRYTKRLLERIKGRYPKEEIEAVKEFFVALFDEKNPKKARRILKRTPKNMQGNLCTGDKSVGI